VVEPRAQHDAVLKQARTNEDRKFAVMLWSKGIIQEADIDQSLVSDDLDLGSISFGGDEEEAAPVKEDKTKKKTKEAPAPSAQASASSYDGNLGRELKEVSQAYSGEMERMQATISNLRSDREELLAKIQKLEEDKILQARQNLTMRAELDEKKIELSIIRKKLNDEITELKDRLKLHEERKLILEEKNKIMMVELDKAAQKNKIDVKKVQMRERELEQKLELLKSDSELQIRNRDLKILELKRKIDAMEFDMESISMQDKRSVESRFELEDKLDKAIKTLRSAISVLEDETEKSSALEALKKNIDM
jgi:chromosome segregation ATPase